MSFVQSCQQMTLLLLNQSLQWQTYFFAACGVLFLSYVALVHTRQKRSNTYKPITRKYLRQLQRKFSAFDVSLYQEPSSSLYAYSKGFLRPSIIFSQGALDHLTQKQLEAVFLHELGHIRHHHLKQHVLLHCLSKIFFFLPVIRDFHHYWKYKAEVDSDRFATKLQGTSKYILRTLSKVLSEPLMPKTQYLMLASQDIMHRITLLQNPTVKQRTCTFKAHNLAVSVLMIFTIVIIHLYQPSFVSAYPAPLECSSMNCAVQCLHITVESREGTNRSVAPTQSHKKLFSTD